MDGNLITIVASVVVAVISGVAAVAAQRAAAKASTMNVQTTSRVDMERDAYERARAFDTETISRQDAELLALRAEVKLLKAQAVEMEAEIQEGKESNSSLKRRVARLEREKKEPEPK